MLCIAAEADPTGYVLVNGRTPTTTDLARMTGEPEAVIQSALEELDRNGVFSRDRNGRIYSRRIVRDARASAINQKNGKEGGSPILWKISKKSPPVKPPDKGDDKPQKPEARSQSPTTDAGASVVGAGAPDPDPATAPSTDRKNGSGKRRSAVAPDWRPSTKLVEATHGRGHDGAWTEDQIARFRDYHGSRGTLFADKDAAFRTWVRNAEDFAARDYRSNGAAGRPASKPGEILTIVDTIRNRRNMGGK